MRKKMTYMYLLSKESMRKKLTHHVCGAAEQVVTGGVEADAGDWRIMGADHLAALCIGHTPNTN